MPYPLDAVEERVLVRLNSNAPDEFEYAVDAVEAFEYCRFVVEEHSMDGVGRRLWRYDIPTSKSVGGYSLPSHQQMILLHCLHIGGGHLGGLVKSLGGRFQDARRETRGDG